MRSLPRNGTVTKTLKQGTNVTDKAAMFDSVLAACPLRSGSFIVTVFGDVAFPGDGQLWIGHLIDLCADLGISESLVRTSVSRLVAGGQLAGIRRGRRSYYALTDMARAEFDHAAQLIYTAPTECLWRFVYFPERPQPEVIGRLGLSAVTANLAFGPAHTGKLPDGVVAFTSPADGTAPDLTNMIAQIFPLDTLAQDYRSFALLARMISEIPATAPKTALQARLLLTHAFRRIALRDPRLPASVLPADHPVRTARHVFAQTYLAFCAQADMHAAVILDQVGTAPTARQTVLKHRYSSLAACLNG